MSKQRIEMIKLIGKPNAIIFCFLLFLFFQNNLTGQPSQLKDVYLDLPAESGEKIGIYTDRSVYCVNEKVYFRVNYSCINKLNPFDWSNVSYAELIKWNELKSFNWSNVLYVELIKWNGFKLIQLKLKLDKDGTSGYLEIPGNIVSGNYYLRAYTKWMRNFSANDYGYTLIKIVNPYRPEVDNGPQDTASKKNLEYVELKSRINGVYCTATEKTYKTRQDVNIELTLNKEFSKCNKYCVSVTKAGVLDTSAFIINTKNNIQNSKRNSIEYLPEIRGITISGKIIDKTGSQLNDILISASDSRNGEYFSVYKTRRNGRFLFSLPDLQGDYEFYITANLTDSIPIEILIDNDFCNNPVILPYIPFQLDDYEKELVKEMMINVQLHDRYFIQAEKLDKMNEINTKPLVFYGKPKSIIYTKNYIELPNLKEFFSELVPEIYVLKRKGEYYLENAENTGVSGYPLLVLMDNIPVHDVNELLKIPLERIERVEVIDEGYVIANIKYNGLVNIYSVKKDFAGIELNKNSIFINYLLLSENNIEYPVCKTDKPDERIPDRRNILFWQPDVEICSSKKTRISFKTSDIKGNYILYVRGISDNDGAEVYGKYSFSVE